MKERIAQEESSAYFPKLHNSKRIFCYCCPNEIKDLRSYVTLKVKLPTEL